MIQRSNNIYLYSFLLKEHNTHKTFIFFFIVVNVAFIIYNITWVYVRNQCLHTIGITIIKCCKQNSVQKNIHIYLL